MAQAVKKRPDREILGQKEDAKTEFKQKEILWNRDVPSRTAQDVPGVRGQNWDSILREVVGMLNGKGGKIWIGVEEEKSVAVRLQDIDNAENIAGSLRDSILDLIVPREQVAVSVEEFESGRVILIDVPKGDSGKIPYALCRRGSVQVYQRFEDMIRPLTFLEIRSMITKHPSTQKSDVEETAQRLKVMQTEFSHAIGTGTGLWVAISPVPPKDGILEIQSDRVNKILLNPTDLGIRREGWTWWGGMSIKQMRLKGGAVELGVTTPVYKLLRAYRNGCITYAQGMAEMLAWRNPDWVKEKGLLALYPYAAVENPVSVFRLASYLWSKDFHHSGMAVAEIIFGPVADWILLPYQADSMGYMTAPHLDPPYGCTRPENRFVHVRINFDHAEEIIKAPDRCAMRLLVQFYEEFGHSQDKIPFYNAQEGKFKFP